MDCRHKKRNAIEQLVNTTNKAKARAKIQGRMYLNQRFPKKKQPLKMSLNSLDNQANKKAIVPQAKDKANQAK